MHRSRVCGISSEIRATSKACNINTCGPERRRGRGTEGRRGKEAERGGEGREGEGRGGGGEEEEGSWDPL